jgi:beta-fructofuranosidase
MLDGETRVGFVHDGSISTEQAAALDWLDGQPCASAAVAFADLAPDAGEAFDALWWHRDAPLDDGLPTDAAATVGSFLGAGGGLVLSLRAMAAVDAFGIDPVAPDAVGVDGVSEPTGVLWRTLYDDHPAVAGVDALRVPVCDCGAVPTARYEGVLPARGEVLAGTVRGVRDVPNEMSVVSWDHDGSAVLGVGAPVAFHEPVAADVADARARLTAGCLAAVAGDHDPPSRPKSAAELRGMRERLAGDPTRPQYHLTPPANWLNDPNGVIRWQGRYHVFYQYNPAGPFHNTIHWGHAVSDDLVHWTDEPVALTPSPDGPDRHGCWSGCAVDDDGTATVLYTGGRDRWQLPCLATTADPNLCGWTKHADNPVIEGPPPELDLLATEHWAAEFRDHSVWRDGDTWYQVIGTGVTDVGGAVLLYSSGDLEQWEYEGPLLVGDDGHGVVWECPELLDFGDRQLLHVSDYENVVYSVGRLRDGRFEVDRRGVLDHGDFYAPQSLFDADAERYLAWGWLPETRGLSEQWDAGWSGTLSLPRLLAIGPDGDVRQRPAAELVDLREREVPEAVPSTLAAGDRHTLDAAGRALELRLVVGLDDAAAFELSVFESPDREERTVVRYTRENEVVVDRTAASAAGEGTTETQRMPVTPYDEPLELRVFLDGSVVELFANERHCLTSRVYPTRPDSTGVSLASEGGRTTLRSVRAWELADVSRWDAGDSACPGE